MLTCHLNGTKKWTEKMLLQNGLQHEKSYSAGLVNTNDLGSCNGPRRVSGWMYCSLPISWRDASDDWGGHCNLLVIVICSRNVLE